jgi:hypothetical protein
VAVKIAISSQLSAFSKDVGLAKGQNVGRALPAAPFILVPKLSLGTLLDPKLGFGWPSLAW